jgi:uncharacterized membrane protein
MSLVVWGMLIAGLVVLAAGLVLVRPRFLAASGAGRVIVLGPVFAATAIAMFAAEHFLAARGLAMLVPKWLTWPLFWTYFFGVALLAAAISFVTWRCVQWSAPLLALFFLLVVITIDLPNLPKHLHERLFLTLTIRETVFGAGATVLAGSVLPRTNPAGPVLMAAGRVVVGLVLVCYAIEHFLFPLYVPGVPLEKLIPAWWPGPAVLSGFVGITELLAGIGLLMRPTFRIAAAGAGAVLLLLTALFYVPIFLTELGDPTLGVEGMNYIGDTMLFAATVLLGGFGRTVDSDQRSVVSFR